MIYKLVIFYKLIIFAATLVQICQTQQTISPSSMQSLTCSYQDNYPHPYFEDNCLIQGACSEWNILILMVFNNRNSWNQCQYDLKTTTSPCRDHSYLFMHSPNSDVRKNPIHGSGNIDSFLSGLQASDSRPDAPGVAELTKVLKTLNQTATNKLIQHGVNRAIIMTDFSCQILCQDAEFIKTLLSTLTTLFKGGYDDIEINFVYGAPDSDDCNYFSSAFQQLSVRFSQECVPDVSNSICDNRFANLTPPPNDLCETIVPTSDPTETKPKCELNTANCAHWTMYYFIFTMYTQDLLPVVNMTYEIVSGCKPDSEFHLILPNHPGYFLAPESISQNEIADTIANLTPNDYLVEEALYETTAYEMLAKVNEQLNYENGAASIFFFTDLTCDDFCNSKYTGDGVSLEFIKTVSQLTKLGFVVKVFSFDKTAGGNAANECATIFRQLNLSLLPIPTGSDIENYRTCSNYFWADPDESTTLDYVEPSSSTRAPSAGLTKSDVVWIVLGTVLGVILCVACLIKLLCNCDGPRDKISRFLRGWLEKHDRKKFGRSSFFKKASDDNEKRTENAVKANSYTDVSQIVAENRNDAWELPVKNLFIHENEILGSGAFANVYKGTVTGIVPLLNAQKGVRITLDHGLDGFCDAAVKRLPPHADEENRIDFFQEMQFMKKMGYHLHVISMLGCVSHPEDPLILVEYCQHGDLLHFLRSNRLLLKNGDQSALTALRMKNLVSITWQISDGLSYLHSKNFIHRDIAARNVLLTRNMVAKISDFGLCRYIDSAMYTAKGGKLPIKWMAIESLKFYEYSSLTDIWAFGVTMWEIFTHGEGPFQAVQPLDVLEHLEEGHRLQRPNDCPKEIYELMKKCWNEDAVDRPSAIDIKSDLMSMLYSNDENYGYLAIPSQFDRPPIALKANSNKKTSGIENKFIDPTDKLTREPVLSTSEDAILESLHEESQKIDEMDEYSRSNSLYSMEFFV